MQKLDPHALHTSIPRSIRDRAAFASFGVVAIAGTAIAALAATHPAQAASMVTGVTSAVRCATTKACVTGTNTSNGPGVKGSSKSSYGVEGVSITNDGLKGISTSSNGVSASSTSAFGVKGTSSSNDGVYGTTSTVLDKNYNVFAGVVGTTTSEPFGVGVIGSAPGIGGIGLAGLAPSASSTAVGVYGNAKLVGPNSGSATGVEGQTGSGIGVYGTGLAGTGVEGDSDSGFAVLGISNSDRGVGVAGGNGYGTGGYFQGQYAVAGVSNSTTFAGFAGNGANTFKVDAAGDIYYAGTLNALSSAAHGTKVQTFGPKSATPTVEDSGSAQLIGGAAAVRLEPTFASSIDPRVAYRVFVTPDGDTRGLYVAQKTPAGFIVRETQGGRSSLAFDYRIIATSLGAVGQRMSVASLSLLAPADKAMVAKLQARLALAPLKARMSRAVLEGTPLSHR